ncbi:hypothetical protein [Paenibacillus sp. IHBB 10380]|uniref:hypothetical protein n=1 Tax=Paenibacillus sp. IHBB 10380 TaxID=1566358 RepID=UPI0005CFB04E|nr:hypothetical protein [Paenibacillus sp. IHBB 10380]AJS60187.1 hypothetical protein UB51_18920 [Paenibacillus sp. IHBB 10380]
MQYIGNEQVNLECHHGELRPIIGTKHYQAVRVSRLLPDIEGGAGWTFSNAPMLAFWQERFYLQYISNPIGENISPSRTMITTSGEGVNWESPQIAFPSYLIPPGIYKREDGITLPDESYAVMHQRMGFYVAPNGRLLTLGFYGISPTVNIMPNDGLGIGRVVREIHKNGEMGPIYFIRFNRHAGWSEQTTNFPYYTESSDKGFIDSCNHLLSDKLATQQWWEEDQSNDGFYKVPGYKAMSYYHITEEKVVAVWKYGKFATSEDNGENWSEVKEIQNLETAGSKIWAQKTISDEKYALVYNPSPHNSYRWPLALALSEDGMQFDGPYLVSGEVPPRRYEGFYKFYGLNYVRGIAEGNGLPSHDAIWIVYSVNKEDIWITKIPVPIRHQEDSPVDDNFADYEPGEELPSWNIYKPKWSKVEITHTFNRHRPCLLIQNQDPFDYAKAERVFPESIKVDIHFSLLVQQTQQERFIVEIVDGKGNILFSLGWDNDGLIKLKQAAEWIALIPYQLECWYRCSVCVDFEERKFEIYINDDLVLHDDHWNDQVSSVERIVFRTGDRIMIPTLGTPLDHIDIHGQDCPKDPAMYFIQYVKSTNHVFAKK